MIKTLLASLILLNAYTIYKVSNSSLAPYWHIKAMDVYGKIYEEELPLSSVIIKVEPIDYNNESYNSATKTLTFSTSRFH
jgi:hypothetical protein